MNTSNYKGNNKKELPTSSSLKLIQKGRRADNRIISSSIMKKIL